MQRSALPSKGSMPECEKCRPITTRLRSLRSTAMRAVHPPRKPHAPAPASSRSHRELPHATHVSQTMTHFTEPEMQKLAEVYKDFDCLWNIRHKLYKSREVRQNAYKQMLKRLDIPGLTVLDIPKKIKNFRSSYYQELKRIRNSINAGDSEETVYKPKVSWFALADEYLSSIWTEKHLKYYRPKDELKVFVRGKDIQFVKRKKLKPKNDNLATETSASKKVEVIQTTPSKSVEDEFDSFGKYVAAALRSMPQEFSIIAKTELQNTISDIQLRIVRQGSSSSSFDPLCGASTSNFDYHSSGCLTPTSDSFPSSIKIEPDS